MAACRRDFAAAIEAIEADERAQGALERLIEAEELPQPPAEGAVAAALERLDALPRPEGQHPFIAEIEPTLAAMRVALHAVAASEDATRSFGARLSS